MPASHHHQSWEKVQMVIYQFVQLLMAEGTMHYNRHIYLVHINTISNSLSFLINQLSAHALVRPAKKVSMIGRIPYVLMI
jgi:hypothetical protein